MKRKRCSICGKLFAPQGIKKHTNWCVKQQHPRETTMTFEGESITKQRKDDEVARAEQDKRIEKAARHAMAYGVEFSRHPNQITVKVNLKEGTVTIQGGTSGNDNDRG